MNKFNINNRVYNVYSHDLLESWVNQEIYDLQRSYKTPDTGDYYHGIDKCHDHMMTKPLVKTFGSQWLVEAINWLDHIEWSANDWIERASRDYAYDADHIIWDEDSPWYDFDQVWNFMHREGAVDEYCNSSIHNIYTLMCDAPIKKIPNCWEDIKNEANYVATNLNKWVEETDIRVLFLLWYNK